ncbi:MAG: lipoyl(octanoyl) transferase LipB [Myxococcota bacterium]|jgi:lipoyl(octanoyl) transferase|nr:lipoyl(octanoyl) transferase LipB [Myxococcota bacterium]
MSAPGGPASPGDPAASSGPATRPGLQVRDVGLVEYADGLRAQEVLAQRVGEGQIPEQLLLLAHPPVITLGRQGRRSSLLASPEELQAAGVELFQADRGGDVTFHDPGQLIGYPLLRVARFGGAARLVWTVEELVRLALEQLGVQAGRVAGLPGLWVGERKVAALGLRLEHGVSRHGFALNLATPPARWGLIVPCGLAGRGVVSVAELRGGAVSREEAVAAILAASSLLGAPVHPRPPELSCVQVLVVRGDPPELLVVRRTPARGGFWQPVTGMVEPGEEPLAAARRELGEETGLTPRVLEDLGYRHAFLEEPGIRPGATPATPRFLVESTFLARVDPGATARLDPREHDDQAWLPLPAAAARMRWSGNRRAIDLVARQVLSPPGLCASGPAAGG